MFKINFPLALWVVICVSTVAKAGMDSGGGSSSTGSFSNRSSIGSYLATGTTGVGSDVHQSGQVTIFYTFASTNGIVDSDGDGLPDDWEADNGLTVGIDDSESDSDGDGMSALEEYVAGTNPRSASSTAEVSLSKNGSQFSLSIPTVEGRSYALWVSDDLEAWHELNTVIGNGEVREFSFDPRSSESQELFGEGAESTPRFFKIVIHLLE